MSLQPHLWLHLEFTNIVCVYKGYESTNSFIFWLMPYLYSSLIIVLVTFGPSQRYWSWGCLLLYDISVIILIALFNSMNAFWMIFMNTILLHHILVYLYRLHVIPVWHMVHATATINTSIPEVAAPAA